MSKIVVAIGGNALGKTPEEQKEIVKVTAKSLVDFVEQGNDIVIVHGNGPQVGMINNGFFEAHKADEKSPLVGFPECGAMSQGYIGYHLQNAIGNELKARGIDKTVASIVTQSIVDEKDPAFQNPTKPIGNFMTEAEAKELAAKNGWDVVDDAGRGWRRVVPSPKPVEIVEYKMIDNLINNGFITVSTGGGGIPVIEKNGKLEGVSAVIDKDFAASKLAQQLNADKFIILTGVDRVSIRFKQPDEEFFDTMTVDDIDKHIEQGYYAPGSMRPKMRAVQDFVRATGKDAIVGGLEKAKEVLAGTSGTIITLK